MSKFSEKIVSVYNKIAKNKFYKPIIAILLIVLGVLAVTGVFSENVKTKECIGDNSYVEILEQKLEKSLSLVKGVGKASVVITVESGMKTVLAMKTTTKTVNGVTETEETPILINGKPITIREEYPDITGVLIVYEGQYNIAVISKIQQAAVSLLNVKPEKIEILSVN
ncbi:MAG: hypothetical protein SPJ19_04400 [Candidatus Borkfalkiaceae bacterium]|nr:hypothetical protein [Christensenellaceae bacterium]